MNAVSSTALYFTLRMRCIQHAKNSPSVAGYNYWMGHYYKLLKLCDKLDSYNAHN